MNYILRLMQLCPHVLGIQTTEIERLTRTVIRRTSLFVSWIFIDEIPTSFKDCNLNNFSSHFFFLSDVSLDRNCDHSF